MTSPHGSSDRYQDVDDDGYYEGDEAIVTGKKTHQESANDDGAATAEILMTKLTFGAEEDTGEDDSSPATVKTKPGPKHSAD